MNWKRRELLIAAGAILASGAAAAPPRGPRRLRLVNVHTGETFEGPYRDADGPIAEAVADLAALLRDHRANRIGPLEIATLDFLADVMEASGQVRARVLSAYRTPETNAWLVRTRFGVAERSQHLLGRALDVTFDARLGDASRAALAMRRGGVGLYPRSHFIHLDTGPVRSWNLDDAGFDRLLEFGGSPAEARRGPPTVAQRRAIHRAIARRDFLARTRAR